MNVATEYSIRVVHKKDKFDVQVRMLGALRARTRHATCLSSSGRGVLPRRPCACSTRSKTIGLSRAQLRAMPCQLPDRTQPTLLRPACGFQFRLSRVSRRPAVEGCLHVASCSSIRRYVVVQSAVCRTAVGVSQVTRTRKDYRASGP